VVNSLLKIGDVIALKDRFSGHGKFAIVIDVQEGDLDRKKWDQFGYLIMTEQADLIYISECCVDQIHAVLPSFSG